jgi:hypothetical protein
MSLGVSDIHKELDALMKNFNYTYDNVKELGDAIVPPDYALHQLQNSKLYDDCDGFHAGVYQLMIKGKMPLGEAFRTWLAHVAIPSLNDPLDQFNVFVKKNPEMMEQFCTSENTGLIYVATTNEWKDRQIYKIGMTSDLKSRITQLNTGTFEDWYCVFTFETSGYKQLEIDLHQIFKHCRIKINREFFFNFL